MPDRDYNPRDAIDRVLADIRLGDLTPAELIALAQVHATLTSADRIDALDSAVRDLHETLHSRGGAR